MDKALIDPKISQEQAGWVHPAALEFYQTHRKAEKDLYPSERFFLPSVLPKVKSVLDVGCARGGFCDIMKSFNASLQYTGMDINPDYVAQAQKDHPQAHFVIGDGIHFPTPDVSFDLVHCTGILHLNSRYEDMVKAMWKQARSYLLCDFRTTWGSTTIGSFTPDFGDSAAKHQTLPYNILNMGELLGFLTHLTPRPGSVRAMGYNHPVSPSAKVASKDVMMLMVLLDKTTHDSTHVEVSLDVR